MDELLWGAMWLYKATDKQEYFDYIISNAHTFGGIGWSITEFSWDVKYAGLQVLASKVTYKTKGFPLITLFCLISRSSRLA